MSLGGGGRVVGYVMNGLGVLFFPEGINSCCVGLSPGVELD